MGSTSLREPACSVVDKAAREPAGESLSLWRFYARSCVGSLRASDSGGGQQLPEKERSAVDAAVVKADAHIDTADLEFLSKATQLDKRVEQSART